MEQEKEWLNDALEDMQVLYTHGDLTWSKFEAYMKRALEKGIQQGKREALEEQRKSIESSHMGICADGQSGKDMAAAVDLFKKCLLRSIDNRLKSKI